MFRLQSTARWLAITAVLGLLLWQSVGVTFSSTFVWSIVFCAAFTAAVFATAWWLAPDGWRPIERHTDLLVPLGLLAGTLGLLEASSAGGAALATPLFIVPLGFVQVPVSVAWLLRLLLHALFATWTTLLVVEAVRRDRADLAGTLSQSKRRYLPMLVLLGLAWGFFTLLQAAELGLLLAIGYGAAWALGRGAVVVVWLLLAGVLAYHFVFSLATAALLPIAVESRLGFWATLRRGIAESWRYRRAWWKLLLVQYVLLGAWAFVSYRYEHSGGSFNSNTDFNLNFRYWAPWLGDYGYHSQWYSKAMGWLQQEPLPMIATVWALLSGLLSIVVKLAVFERYASAAAHQEPADPQARDPAPDSAALP